MSDEPEAWTFGRILTMLDRESRTGVLEVGAPGSGSTTRVHMRKGYIVGIDQPTGEHAWILGEYLVRTETITRDQLLRARQLSQADGVALEEHLLKLPSLTEDILKRFKDQETSELLYPLFREAGLEIHFLEERPKPASHATTLPVSYVLKEAERRKSVWSQLRERVGRSSAVYQRDDAVMAIVLGYEQDKTPTDQGEPIPELGASTRMVYFHTNGERTVEQVARSSGLTTFETYRAYASLLDFDIVDLVTPHSKGEETKSDSSVLPRIVSVITYGFVAIVLMLGAQWLWTNPAILTPSPVASSPKIEQIRLDASKVQLEDALQMYHLRYGHFPERLSILSTEGLLGVGGESLLSHMAYSTDGQSHDLKWRE